MKLSERERQCLHWKSKGKTTEEIAMILNLKIFTVQTYLQSARKKLNCSKITQAISKAIETKQI